MTSGGKAVLPTTLIRWTKMRRRGDRSVSGWRGGRSGGRLGSGASDGGTCAPAIGGGRGGKKGKKRGGAPPGRGGPPRPVALSGSVPCHTQRRDTPTAALATHS